MKDLGPLRQILGMDIQRDWTVGVSLQLVVTLSIT